MKVGVTVLGYPSVIVLMVSADIKKEVVQTFRAQELCESRGGRPWPLSSSLTVRIVSVDVKQQ